MLGILVAKCATSSPDPVGPHRPRMTSNSIRPPCPRIGGGGVLLSSSLEFSDCFLVLVTCKPCQIAVTRAQRPS